jgi:hypothetical protein
MKVCKIKNHAPLQGQGYKRMYQPGPKVMLKSTFDNLLVLLVGVIGRD